MKVRQGFVSNSSSSSFIVALKRELQNNVCPHCGRKDPGLLELLERNCRSYCETELIVFGEKDTLMDCFDDRTWYSLEDVENLKNKATELEDTHDFCYLTIDYSDESTLGELNKLIRSGDCIDLTNLIYGDFNE